MNIRRGRGGSNKEDGARGNLWYENGEIMRGIANPIDSRLKTRLREKKKRLIGQFEEMQLFRLREMLVNEREGGLYGRTTKSVSSTASESVEIGEEADNEFINIALGVDNAEQHLVGDDCGNVVEDSELVGGSGDSTTTTHNNTPTPNLNNSPSPHAHVEKLIAQILVLSSSLSNFLTLKETALEELFEKRFTVTLDPLYGEENLHCIQLGMGVLRISLRDLFVHAPRYNEAEKSVGKVSIKKDNPAHSNPELMRKLLLLRVKQKREHTAKLRYAEAWEWLNASDKSWMFNSAFICDIFGIEKSKLIALVQRVNALRVELMEIVEREGLDVDLEYRLRGSGRSMAGKLGVGKEE